MLAARRPLSPRAVPEWLQLIHSPLRVNRWEHLLRSHPDREFVALLLSGMREGFRVGYKYHESSCRSAKSNMRSAGENPEVVDRYLATECGLGRVVGPVSSTELGRLPLHVSRFGVIPKGHQPGKWRLIVDLSAPKGASINDGIEPELCSLTYTSVDRAVQVLLELGQGCVMAKLDIKSAYRIVPVHPEDRLLLGMSWKGNIFIDTALPFGLRSAPKLFNAVADALAWIVGQASGSIPLHYLDDFLFLGRPGTDECKGILQTALRLCAELGVPLSEEKLEGPGTVLTFLGIELDSDKRQLRLPKEKLQRLLGTVLSWQDKKVCTKRELLSLIGQLQHACRVVRSGRSFLRRMIYLSTKASELHHHLRLNSGFRSDLQWWVVFLPVWNGIGMMSSVCRMAPQAVVTSDASNWGCGAFTTTGQWFQLQWPASWKNVHITFKELVPVVMAVALWGGRWRGGTILCRSDNAAVVSIVNSGRSDKELAMHLVRTLSFYTAYYELVVVAEHVAGRQNEAADAISRDCLTLFRHLIPQANPEPSSVPPELVGLLVTVRPDWTSNEWRRQFSASLRRDSPPRPSVHTSPARTAF